MDGVRIKMNEDNGPGETVSPVIVKLVEEISICACEIERLEKENAELMKLSTELLKENEKLTQHNENQSAMILVLNSKLAVYPKSNRNEIDKNYALYALAINDAANKRKSKTSS